MLTKVIIHPGSRKINIQVMHIPTAPAGLIPCLSKPNNKKEARVSPSVLTESDIPILLWKSVQNRLSALRKSERDHYSENDQGWFIQGFLLSELLFRTPPVTLAWRDFSLARFYTHYIGFCSVPLHSDRHWWSHQSWRSHATNSFLLCA